MRKENEALMTGNFRTVAADENGLLIYQRERSGQRITVALNGRGNTVSIKKNVSFGTAVLSYALAEGELGPFGYAVFVEK